MMSEETTDTPWTEQLPEALREGPFVKDTESLEAYVSKLDGAAKHMGNSLRIPGPDAGDDDWRSFDEKLSAKIPGLIRANLDSEEGRAELMTRLGRPEEPSGYGAEGDGAWLAEVAFNAGLTKSQFESLVKGVGETNVRRNEETDAEAAQALEALDTEWGLSKSKKMDHIEGLARLTNAPDDVVNAIKEGKMSADMLRWMDRIAGQFAEAAKFVEDRNDPNTITPEEAQAQIQELMNNPEYFTNSPIAKQMQKKMLELQAAANPGASKTIDDLRAGTEILEMFGN